MKTGAEIVAELDKQIGMTYSLHILNMHWPTIRAALIAYTPPLSPLRTILDRVSQQISLGNGAFSTDEIEAARAELDRLERR